ncbi:MAG: DUF1501 domain-containing protein [Burkholderiaceae bacterium]
MSFESSRRRFLRSGLLAPSLARATPFTAALAAAGQAAAQSANDYRALVCVFLFGGNDQGNTVLATDPDSWSAYRALRGTGSSPIALPAAGDAGGVLPIAPATAQGGRSFALHPALGDLADLFAAGQAAVLANVGTLIAPMTRDDYDEQRVPRPPKLFSHNDQQSVWQSSRPEGARTGWGGRLGDHSAGLNATSIFTCMSTGENAVWLAGEQTIPFRAGTSGATEIVGLTGSLFGSPTAAALYRDIVTSDSPQYFERAHAGVVRRAIDAQAALNDAMIASSALEPAPRTPSGGTNGLAVQLNTVARIIGARTALGARRQLFFVGLGGFDTHDDQLTRHAGLLGSLGQALAYFQRLLADPAVGASNDVTTFTASDFGRTMASNGDGTDHGWGSHHFVVGSAVRGGDIYGRFPVIGIDTPDDVGRGRLLPVQSVDQYAATLAGWFGLSPSLIDDVFPNLVNFGSARDLGFML